MSRKARSQKTTNEELGQPAGPVNGQDAISQKSLEAFAAIVEDKLVNVATKECISELKQTILDQQVKIQELEAKVVVMEKYIERIEKVERRVCEVDGLSDRIADLERVCDDNEQYQRRLCLRIYGVEAEEDAAESGHDYLEMVKKMFKEDLGLDIPEVVIDRAHRIGHFKEIPESGKKFRSIVVRFTTWRHRTAVYSARKKTDKFRISLDLTHQRVKLLKRANELLKNDADSYAFADVNCRLCIKHEGKYQYFKDLYDLYDIVKYG
eukprot:Seg966.2 transcript_id=Seg966.2/GoldUCD/mRNA.D3Y31 product="hypothetical protein" protein_id=Seg966.2/GoldUCD/D3Y31